MTFPADLTTLDFDNRFTRELPADKDASPYPRQVMGASYSRVTPKQFAAPKLVAHSREVAELLGLGENAHTSDAFARVFAGNEQLPGMDPFAMCYGGHQFGNWAGQLGDGRAINLGEVHGTDGAHWMLQLKGAGQTPYSRGGDGLAVLRSSVREFLCSEAMFHLGVPTTRALSLVRTGELVERDMFYDGNPKDEPGAVVCRVARSFIRFGSFEILAARGEKELLQKFTDFTIRSLFPHLGEPSQATYAAFFEEVCRTTAAMVVEWMRVGFVHGVMNTDNLSILGETIDYGPYGWLENFDPNWTPNTTDAHGRRYRFGHQGRVAQWNLVQLANALVPLFDSTKPLEAAVNDYASVYEKGWREMMASKLGFSEHNGDDDAALIGELMAVFDLAETDMTVFFRGLADVDVAADTRADERIGAVIDAYYVPTQLAGGVRERLGGWLDRYADRVRDEDDGRAERMNAVNPKYVLRNYLAQLAIDKAEKGDDSLVIELLDVLRRPYDEQPTKEEHAAKRPDWARERPGCSMLSCSS